jgi:putative NADH-flavin reductase
LKLLVIGATGRTGRLVTAQALARGHEVTALVRRSSALDPAERLRIVVGDPLRVDALAPVLKGQHVVISCLGQRSRHDTRLLQDAATAALTAMRRSGVHRYLVVSQGLLFPSRNPLVLLLRLILARPFADTTAMENLIRKCDVGWTIVRAPRLLEGGAACGYRVEGESRPRDALTMQYADVAAFLVDEAERPAYVNQIVGVAAGLAKR